MTFWPSNSSAKLRPLKHLARLNPEVLSEDTDPDFEFDYIDIGGVTLEEGVRQKEAMRFEAAPSRARKPVRKGDVIVSTVRTYLKAVARIDDTHNRAVVSTGFAVLRPNAGVDAGYLYRLCQANPFVGDVQAQSTGVSYPAINPSALAALKVPLPELDTQKAIAAYLDRETTHIDQLIAKKERLQIVLSEKSTSLIAAAVSGDLPIGQQSRLRGKTGMEGGMMSSLAFPAKPLRRLVTIRSSNVDKIMEEGEEMVRLCNYVDVYYNDRITGDMELSDGSAKPREIAKFALLAGDVIITKDSETPDDIAVPSLVDPSAEGVVCGYHLAILRAMAAEIFGSYLFWALKAKPTREAFGNAAQGVTRYGLTLNGIGSVSIPVPDLDTQKAIAAYLDRETEKLDVLKRKIAQSISQLRERRAALITAAVTGQLDIREKLPAVMTKPDRTACRVIVGAEIIHLLPDNPKRGRVKVHKLTYLAETHLGIGGVQGNYLREAAGPLDRALIAETERGLGAAGYFRANQTEGTGTAVTYAPLAKAGQHKAELDALLGPKAADFRKLIALFADFDRASTEAVATLYAVWNDALIDGQTPDDAAIINGVLNDWHTEKGEKFTAADLTHWLAWMKRHTLIPRGQEPRTKSTMTQRLFS